MSSIHNRRVEKSTMRSKENLVRAAASTSAPEKPRMSAGKARNAFMQACDLLYCSVSVLSEVMNFVQSFLA